VDQDGIGIDPCEPNPHRILPFYAASNDLRRHATIERGCQQVMLIRSGNDMDCANAGMRRERIKTMRNKRFSGEQRELLGQRIASADAFPGSDDQGSNAHGYTALAIEMLARQSVCP
jgi:hypothetical protein